MWYGCGVWKVVYLPEAEQEQARLPVRERTALHNAVVKLQALGPTLGYPHSSAVRSVEQLRELRPRAGRSPWRGLYRQVGETFVLAAIAPEAQHNEKKFQQACRAALDRLREVEE